MWKLLESERRFYVRIDAAVVRVVS
jgi:hypothetical protein